LLLLLLVLGTYQQQQQTMETQSTITGVGVGMKQKPFVPTTQRVEMMSEAEVDKDGNIFTSSPTKTKKEGGIHPIITEFVIRNCICTLPGAFTFTSLHLRSILIVGLVLLVFPLVLNLRTGESLYHYQSQNGQSLAVAAVVVDGDGDVGKIEESSTSTSANAGNHHEVKLKHQKKILYIVRSYPESYERLGLQAQTWMNHLDSANEAVLVASQFSPNELGMRKYAQLPDALDFTIATPKCGENNHGMGLCCQEAHAFLEATTKEKFRTFDWFLFIDDDVFVSPSIIRQLVQDYNETALVSIGTKGCASESYSGFCGGGGYLVSHSAMKKMAALPSFESKYMNICNRTQYCDIVTAWMLENEANVTLVNEGRFHPWGMEVAKVNFLDKNYENGIAWEVTHRLIRRREHYISHPQKLADNNSSSTTPLPTKVMFDHLLKTPQVLHAVASRQYATLHYFGGDLTKEYSTQLQKAAFLNLLYDVALDENEQAEHSLAV
jgi:hypothetical protein